MAQLELDVVLLDGETVDDVIKYLTRGHDVTCVVGPQHNCWPTLVIDGPADTLRSIRRRYDNWGKNTGKLVGKPPVAKGQRRV